MASMQNEAPHGIWTHEDRNKFIRRAVNSEEQHGKQGVYHYNLYPKNQGHDTNEDPRRSTVTQLLAKTIYEYNPAFRKISIAFYEILCAKIKQHPYLSYHLGNDLIVMMKGGNAYAYVTREEYPEEFSFSDMDIVVYINPYLNDYTFSEIERNVRIVVLQTLSQYKRMLDQVLFLNNLNYDDAILDTTTIHDFKEALNTKCEEAGFKSPFSSTEARNHCSRNSFMIANSLRDKNKVAMIELPHFERCERIPLRKTPLFCSYNQTIDFDRAENCKGQFDLYRIRMNILSEENEKIPADMIDVSIAAKSDAELMDFWTHGLCLCVREKHVGTWLIVPDIYTCIGDLHKMLFVYECPESKREKREKKYKKMKELLAAYRGLAKQEKQNNLLAA